MDTQYFYNMTYCPADKEYVTYEEGCRGCQFNQYYDSICETVDCTYDEHED